MSACGGGSGSDQRAENTAPSLQLSDGQILGNGNVVVRIPASDDTGIASVSATLLRQGRLEECRSQLDFSIVRDSLLQACLTDQPTCAVEFIPSANEIVVYPPPLYGPVGLEFELFLVDRDGSASDPTKAVFCFDVGENTPPVPAADTYQLVYPSFIQKNGVNYDARCEKRGGSDGVLANDDDDEHITNTCLSAELVDLPRFASNLSTFSQSFRPNGAFRYEALANAPASTTDSFTYRVTDGVNPPSAPIKVEIVFSGENSAPVVENDSYTLPEDSQAQTLNVLDNDVDPDALPLTITSIFNGPASGTATIRNGVVIEYVPNENFSGQDQFSYNAIDSGGLSANATVSITVTGVNDPPVAQNDAVSTDENQSVQINVLANDFDPEGNSLSVTDVAPPLNGVAVRTESNSITYTPNANYSGTDSFEYTIGDGNGGSDTATAVVTIRFINVAPVANADSLLVEEGGVDTLDVIANDTDPDGDTLTLTQITQPANGTAEIISDSSVRYTPDAMFNGADSFSYTVSDSTVSATAQVNVTVTSVNDLPVAVDDTASTTENSPVTIDVVVNDTDPDGDSLTVTAVTSAANGTVAISGNQKNILYTPDNRFSGTDNFNYTIDDGNGGTDSATVTIQVTDTNSGPVANDDTASTTEDTAVTIDVLSNDSDPDSDPLTLSGVGDPSNGTAVISQNRIVYTPGSGFDGTDVFDYQIEDDSGLSATAQVIVTVTDVNQAPVAVNDTAAVSENGSVTIDVLSNDSDADGDSLTITAAGSPASGGTAIQDNRIVYTPVAGFSGQDEFDYKISDGKGGSASASVVVTVSSVNLPPVAVDDAISNEQDDAISIAVLANDSDPEGDTITVQSTEQPSNGTAAISPNGRRIVYNPLAGFFGVDSFVYTITDGNGATDSATVTITVIGSNVPPVANDDIASTQQDVAITIDVTANDTDANGDTVVLDDVLPADNGTTQMVNGSVLYTPDTGFSGADTFSYKINDGNGGEATASVAVTVSAVNIPPVALDDTGTMLQDSTAQFDVLANDTDANGDELTLTVNAEPGNGAAAVVNGQISYTPDTGFTGIETIEYTVSDGNDGTDTATLTVTVTEVVVVNNPPVALDDTGTMLQDGTEQFDVLANDSDADEDELTLTITAEPANGTAVVDSDQIAYTPDPGFTGSDIMEYAVSDGNGGTDTATLAVTVTEATAE